MEIQVKRFREQNQGNKTLAERAYALASVHVMCRIITKAKPEFITTVTINNNRQNPVKLWSLHANDTIQLELQDKCRDDLRIYYERQQGACENLSDEYLDDRGITETHKIELTLLGRTFLISDGEIDKLSRFREVFEEDRLYAQVFNAGRVRADARKILLCYTIQFRLRRLLNDILEEGRNRYGPYVNRARNMFWALLCQAVLNDPKLEERAEAFGRDLRLPAQFTDWLSGLATTRCRFIVGDLVTDKQ
jgi:AIPR protein